MKKTHLLLLYFVLFSFTSLSQPANDEPCNARLIIPASSVCQQVNDNSPVSTTSLLMASVTTGFGVVDYNCDFTPSTALYDVWFKIPLQATNMLFSITPIAGFDVAMQFYYRESGLCSTNDFTLAPFLCGNVSGPGVADSILIPHYYSSLYDTLYLRIYHHPDGRGPAPVNNSQFSICAYYPVPECTTNNSPSNNAQVLSIQNLQWNYSITATSYKVYLGSSVLNAVLIGNTDNNNFDISGLNLTPGIYYWYVVPVNGAVVASNCSTSATSFEIIERAPNDLICNAHELFSTDGICTTFVDNSVISTTSYYRSTYTPGIAGGGVNCNSSFFLNADVWFKFIPGDSAFYIFRIEPVAGINTSFRVYESSTNCSGSFASKGCFNNGSVAQADTALVLLRPGKEYFIQVFSQNGSRDFNPPGNSHFGICIYKKQPTCVSPLLVSPDDGSITVDHMNGSLRWKSVADASLYKLYIGTSAGNMQHVSYSVLQSSGGDKVLNFAANFVTSSPFSPGVQYFWKVIPANGNLINLNCGEEIRSFTTYVCPPSLNSKIATITANAAGELDFTFPCINCPPSWLVFEYGPNPVGGSGTIPAANNFVVYPAQETTTTGYKGFTGIDSVHQISSYYYYTRIVGCSGANQSYLPFNPGNATTMTVCNNTAITIGNGKGRWNFAGAYPVNSNSNATPGKMTWFNFTPAESGVYYIQVDSVEINDPVDYLYKAAPLNRFSSANWTGIGAINSKGKYAIGSLTAGITYYFVTDRQNETLITYAPSGGGLARHFIKICKANVLSPSITNLCIDATIANAIPASSPKEEFAIDTAGNLIASIIPGAEELGQVAVSYYVNGNGIRIDANGREYLDRNYTITPSQSVSSMQRVKLYFTNSELDDLINFPNDGNADVHSINDLVVTKTNQNCATSSQVGTLGNLFITPNGRGSYDAASSFVEIPVNSFSTFYLHGGTDIILPLRFLDFTLMLTGTTVRLNWITTQEENTSHYEVERSDDGIYFSSIGRVSSMNTPGVHYYLYNDLSAPRVANYYRIKQVDIDGRFSYSIIRRIVPAHNQIIQVYPTITRSVLHISGLKPGQMLVFSDLSGRTVATETATSIMKEMKVSHWPSGVYQLTILEENMPLAKFNILKY